MQPRRTRRRKGRGTLVQPLWEQERPVSALAVRSAGCHFAVDQEQMCPISRVTAKWTHAERESERSIVPSMPWQQNHGGGKGPYLVCGFVEGKRW